ncbi:MAG: transposase [Gammaproteobacteria bacterium]|jgi:REP element-mobilizing transposase RayT|nr:transposase [Gammaproteobacteria bacterium]
MTLPRSSLVSLASTPYYHCIGRCVRRAFLCGVDAYSGRSFEHRRGWIVERLASLSSVFAMDVAAYAVMSNHYHVVLKINADAAASWSVEEVLERWCRLFSGHPIVQRYLVNPDMGSAELEKVTEFVELYRARLADLSWFMRCLNEPIARMANEEDGCTGRFWEGRFKSQALLDEAALIACMAYVDLNPIRAGMAETPEASDYTSIQQRIAEISGADDTSVAVHADAEDLSAVIPRLMNFAGRLDCVDGLPCELKDYLELVDWSGRAIHPHKRGRIADHQPKILQRLQIEPTALLRYLSRKEDRFHHVIGSKSSIRQAAARLGRQFLQGIAAAERLFPQRI